MLEQRKENVRKYAEEYTEQRLETKKKILWKKIKMNSEKQSKKL